ncbi:hypothetical protein [Ammoniphilus sp. YIM 78166]|uniref:hypothetical protein n=1 Tax=Ammoniphilus sp. YIM 78166 TaxID=1644106 RepID=UPI00106FBCE4|nr:hypothetical protein [Ammoniphilus sp. YIM 78166]
MKLSKKKMTVLSFTLGACVFVSTAFADVMLGSGYDRLKNSAKQTASQMEKGLDNYTIEALFTLKDNNQTLFQASSVQKYDPAKKTYESQSVTQQSSGEVVANYSYADEKISIWKNGTENKYYVTTFPDDFDRTNWNRFTNPFNEKGAPEVEKIVDALVGNLKDYVQAEERPEGGKVYSGTLSEAQVPAVISAVSSFGIKKMMEDHGRMEPNSKLPEVESDIYVKKVSGTAIENKAGLLESVTGDVVLSGKDKFGVEHELMLNMVFKLSDIGTTMINKPSMAGAEVEEVSHSSGFTSKHVGTYKNNIVIEKNGKFVKIGQRTLEITKVEKNNVTGRYVETIKPGFEADYPEVYQFDFEYDPSYQEPRSFFKYTNPKGEEEQGEIHPSSNGKLYVSLNVVILDQNSYRSNDRPNFDSEFNRVFEE